MIYPVLNGADIIFTAAQGGGFISRRIMGATRTCNEPETRASHVALISVPAPYMPNSVLIEETHPHQDTAPLSKYLKPGINTIIYRRIGISPNQKKAIINAARADIGKRYGYGKILLFIADAWLGKIVSFPICMLGKMFGRTWRGIEFPIFSRLNITRDLVCSQTVARYYYEQAGISFGRHWLTQNPDSMLDYCEAHPFEWRLIYDSTK